MTTFHHSNRGGLRLFVAAAACLALAAAVTGFDLDRLSGSDEMVRMSGYGEEKLSTVLVTGTLICTSCSSRQPKHEPVSGALVAATCSSKAPYTAGDNKPVWEKAITDDNGEFIIDLPSHLHAIPNLQRACSVKVLLLPNASPCASAMFRSKNRPNRISLSSVGNGIRTYTAGAVQLIHGDSKHLRACKRTAMKLKQDMSW